MAISDVSLYWLAPTICVKLQVNGSSEAARYISKRFQLNMLFKPFYTGYFLTLFYVYNKVAKKSSRLFLYTVSNFNLSLS